MSTRPDPLTVVTLVCERCDVESFATEAAWLDERHLVARFSADCAHAEDNDVRVVDVCSLIERCAATTRYGLRCQNRAMPTSDFCRVHAARRQETP